MGPWTVYVGSKKGARSGFMQIAFMNFDDAKRANPGKIVTLRNGIGEVVLNSKNGD